MQDQHPKEKSFTTFQVAGICDVYPSTVIRWVKEDRIKAYKTPGGHRRVLKADLIAFLKQYKLPIPEELNEQRKRILIVDDEASIGTLITRALNQVSDDVQVETMADGIGALVYMGKRPPDLLILDVVMPILDGASVLSSLRADPQTHKMKVVAITGKRLTPEKLAFMKRHSDAFFMKPFDIKLLVTKVLSLLGVSTSMKNVPGG